MTGEIKIIDGNTHVHEENMGDAKRENMKRQRSLPASKLERILSEQEEWDILNPKSRPGPVPVRYTARNSPPPAVLSQTLRKKRVELAALSLLGPSVVGKLLADDRVIRKEAFLRYTTDGWCTYQDQPMRFLSKYGNSDCYGFTLNHQGLYGTMPLWRTMGPLTLEFAVWCRFDGIGGEEVWDNNGGRNFIVDIQPDYDGIVTDLKADILHEELSQDDDWWLGGDASEPELEVRRSLSRSGSLPYIDYAQASFNEEISKSFGAF
eukprot:comp19474_c1_seq1/m.22674 comp19474_c1_seq1/g.22674  ORF comp19474_c1_seq1/g.22674 comp19474_c1_seq1/m.22674 type:complete len:264 (-) comp19474_c1_seq1:362-1153(-)